MGVVTLPGVAGPGVEDAVVGVAGAALSGVAEPVVEVVAVVVV